MTPTDAVLIALVWAVVGLTVMWARTRRNVRDLGSNLARTVAIVNAISDHVLSDDSRSRAADIDVPDVDDHPDAPTTPTYRPVPDDFNRNR